MMTIGSLLVGGSLGVISLCGFALNVFVLIVMIKGGFLAGDSNVMYLMAFNLLISDTLQIAISLFYQAPASALQREICAPFDINLSRFGGFTGLSMWNHGGIMLALLSLNRLVQICYPEYVWLFTRRKTAVLCIAVWPFSFVLATISQYVLPCCEFVVSYRAYSYGYLTKPNVPNYSANYLDMSSNCLCSLITIVSYSMIFYKVRATRCNLSSGLSDKQHTKRRLKEYSFAMQFLAISSCYTVGWISIRIYPLFVPLDQPKWFAVIAALAIFNSSINSLIYVYYNPDVNRASRKLVGATVSESSINSAATSLLKRELLMSETGTSRR